ncbi:MAG: tetratricopeptide repeat protein [Spirochaetaceae bacterium]|nr:tetratricopeptide repeat protein [Spirochaetaceae bacterium]
MNTSKIIYINLPEDSELYRHIQEDANHKHGKTDELPFTINPKIPLPVEIEPGQAKQDISQNLTLEMILSGMIKTLKDDPSCRYQNYYRRFVRAAKPRILRELAAAALVKAENGDFDFACEIAAAAKAIFPKSAKALHTRASVLDAQAAYLEKTGQNAHDAKERAALAYHEALSIEEPLVETLLSAGRFYYRYENYGNALKYLRAYIPLADNKEQQAEARELVKRIETAHLDDALFGEARALIENGKEEEGLEKIRVFLQNNAEVWNAHFLEGLALRRLKRWDEALAAFRKAQNASGAISDTLNEIAICLLELGRTLEAKKELETALLNDSENVKILSNLALVELKLGHKEQALAFFRTVTEYAPDDPIAKRFLEL